MTLSRASCYYIFNMHFNRIFLGLFFILAALCVVGCSDDKGSSPDNEEVFSSAEEESSSSTEITLSSDEGNSSSTDVKNPSSSDTKSSSSTVASSSSSYTGNMDDPINCPVEFADLVIDEKEQILYLTNKRVSDYCVINGDNYELVSETETNSSQQKYIFVGDTLIFLYNDGGHTYGSVLVGGKKDSPYGFWLHENRCNFDYETLTISCNDTKPYTYRTYIQFTQNSMIGHETDAEGNCLLEGAPDLFDDYTNSGFMGEIYKTLLYYKNETSYVYYDALHPFETFYEDEFTLPDEIIIKEKTKNAAIFTIAGQEFKAHFNEDCYRIQYYSGSKENVSAYVESNGVSCEINYFSDSKITKDMCKAENAKYLKNIYTREINGIEQKYAESYIISNANEFKNCLKELATQTP